MLGAIVGDIIGSVHEFSGTKTTEFELFHPHCTFTDDTVLAVAVADCLLHGSDYVEKFHEYFRAYPDAGYGFRFFQWASSGNKQPYNSWGNGSAMRVPAVGYAFDSLDEVLAEAKRSAEVTHNHPEGVRGAQATAAAVFLARKGKRKEEIRDRVEEIFGYDLHRRLDEIRPSCHFDESCSQGPCRLRSSRSWSHKTTRMLFGRRYHLVAMPTHWPALREQSPKPTTGEFPNR